MAMAERKKIYDITEDRVSELPRDLIDRILERMNMHDVVKTSILSKKWRYMWAAHPQLVLDEQFFQRINKNKQDIRNEFVRIVNKILLLHNGPVLKFTIYIPNIQFNHISDMDQWILVLSRNGIKELTVNNSYREPYKLPSYILSCSELIDLKLCNCIFKPPLAFGGFHTLISLFLENISFSGNTSEALPTRLQRLSLRNCTGLEYLRIHALELYWIVNLNSHKFDWQCFEINKNLTTVCVALLKKVEHAWQGKAVNLLKFLGSLPRIKLLWLDGFSLEFLAAGFVPKLLQTTINHLLELRFFIFKFNNLDQIACAFCLLRSSPNLQNLEIWASAVEDKVNEGVINYLEAWDCMVTTLDRLQMVKINCMKGLKTELLFIKLLLAHSPSLEWMLIELSSEIGVSEALRISRELMSFSRASTMAKIIF